MLLLRVPAAEVPTVLGLDISAPLFWPVLSLRAFENALAADYARRCRDLTATGFEPEEAGAEARAALERRVENILSQRPELAGHFCAALFRTELPEVALALNGRDTIPKLLIPHPARRLNELAQVAARRFDRLPTEFGNIKPRQRPEGLGEFHHYLQAVIDAPLVAAEFTAEARPVIAARDLLTLINLRLVDPGYFDAALPAAVSLQLERQRHDRV